MEPDTCRIQCETGRITASFTLVGFFDVDTNTKVVFEKAMKIKKLDCSGRSKLWMHCTTIRLGIERSTFFRRKNWKIDYYFIVF